MLSDRRRNGRSPLVRQAMYTCEPGEGLIDGMARRYPAGSERPQAGIIETATASRRGQMPRRRGRHLSTETIEKIKGLLVDTDLSIRFT